MLIVDTLRAGCRNARLTARLANRGLTVTERLTCGRVARSTVRVASNASTANQMVNHLVNHLVKCVQRALSKRHWRQCAQLMQDINLFFVFLLLLLLSLWSLLLLLNERKSNENIVKRHAHVLDTFTDIQSHVTDHDAWHGLHTRR